jgi:class 3 adenylate cyclase/ketosteroid isomerase-like protein
VLKEVVVTVEHDIAGVRLVLYQFADRYNASDAEGVLALFAEEPLVVGTGADELRIGTADMRLQLVRDMSEVDALSMSIDNLRVNVIGDAAFGYSEVTVSASADEEYLRLEVRSTIGLIRTSEGWRITQLHTSVPHGEQAPGRSFPVQLTKTLSSLLTSIDGDSESSALDPFRLGTTTILFTDVVDSTSLSQSMGDRKWSDLIMSHFDTVKKIVEDEGGQAVKTLGDGGMYAFQSGASALLAAVRAQQAVAMSSEDGLRVRMGVHTGDVIQGRDDYIGLTVNKAARVAAAADGDQILVSSTTVDVVNTAGFVLGNPFPAELKGVDGIHLIQELQWTQTSEEASTARS